MAYIGRQQDGFGVRSRFIFTATGGQTTFTTDDSSNPLSYSDGAYVDVYLNGVLLDPSDYTATSLTSIVLDSGASASDILEVIVYDVFSVFSGTFTNGITANTATVTGDLTVDTNTLFVDASADAVGVNKSAPAMAMDIVGANNSQLRIDSSDTNDTTFFLDYNGGGATNRIRVRNAAGDLAFNVSNTAEAMRIDSSGNVGIGVTDPASYYAENLVVKAPAEGGITIRSNATTDANYLMFADGTSGTQAYRGYLGYIHNSPEHFNIVSHGYMRFYTGDPTQERMRIDSSGNVLVGTTTSGGSGGVTLRNDGIMIAPAVYGTAVSASLRDIQMDSSGFFGYSTSTRATKGNIEDLSDVSWLYNLNPVSFNRKVFDRETNSFKDELSPETEYGLIAEDVEAVNKNLCFYNETEDGQELAGITYSKLITPLIKALQEANAKIKTLEAKVTALENA